jgi:3',5'-cyclic AMP phosphodiesterase CpdA
MNVRRARYCTLWLLLVLTSLSCAGGGEQWVSGPTPAPIATVLLAAGDVGVCGAVAAVETGQMLDGMDGTIVALGDLAYRHGTAQEFETCYDPVWGRHKARTRPSPGNHEYETSGALPYYDYFGAQAGPAGLGYYSFRSGDWLVLSLNSNLPIGGATAQAQWIRTELTASTARCTLAYFHHPLYSSGPNGDNARLAGLWQMLYEQGVDVVLSAHEHLYERFAPMSPDGLRDDARGIRQFIVGTGGAGLYTVMRAHPQSEVRVVLYGILKLTLNQASYTWEFRQPNGTRADSGSDVCH